MNVFDGIGPAAFGSPVAGFVGLLVGWLLGRKSAGTVGAVVEASPEPGAETALEADPWAEAALGRVSVADQLDNFETDWEF